MTIMKQGPLVDVHLVHNDILRAKQVFDKRTPPGRRDIEV